MNNDIAAYRKALLTLSILSVILFAVGIFVQCRLSALGIIVSDHTGKTVWEFIFGTGFYGCGSLKGAIICFSRSFKSIAFICVVVYMLSFTVYAYISSIAVTAIISFVFGTVCCSNAEISARYLISVSAGLAVLYFWCKFSSEVAVTGISLARKIPTHLRELLSMPDVKHITFEMLLSSGKFSIVVIFSQFLLAIVSLMERSV